MKKTLLAIMAIMAITFISACGKKPAADANQSDQQSQALFSDTLDISKQYMYLHYRTEMLLTQPATYADHATWNADMDALLADWAALEASAGALEGGADKYVRAVTPFWQAPYAMAVTTQEINDIFDKAPAGQKIKTLAKHLGVDAKRAALILKQAQDQTEADAWNEAGDTFQKLETSAVVIKDGCKVVGFVGGIIVSGGTAGLAAATTVTKAAVIVSGADLVLEVTEDGAKIALGNHNKVAEFIGDVRKVTEPVGTILSISSVPDNLASGIDKFNAVMLALDQFRSAAQEGKVVGIELPAHEAGKTGKILGGAMTEAEISEWLAGIGIKPGDEGYAEIMERIGQTIEVKESGADAEQKTREEAFEAMVNGQTDSAETVAQEAITTSAETEEKLPAGVSPVFSKDGKVKAVFSSPAEDTFIPRQARGWIVDISGFDNQDGLASYECDFVFYLNGSKYQEMLNNRGCGFTHTFIEQEGKLRAEVTIRFMKNRAVFNDDGSFKELAKDVYETMVLNREFTVAKPVRK